MKTTLAYMKIPKHVMELSRMSPFTPFTSNMCIYPLFAKEQVSYRIEVNMNLVRHVYLSSKRLLCCMVNIKDNINP